MCLVGDTPRQRTAPLLSASSSTGETRQRGGSGGHAQAAAAVECGGTSKDAMAPEAGADRVFLNSARGLTSNTDTLRLPPSGFCAFKKNISIMARTETDTRAIAPAVKITFKALCGHICNPYRYFLAERLRAIISHRIDAPVQPFRDSPFLYSVGSSVWHRFSYNSDCSRSCQDAAGEFSGLQPERPHDRRSIG